MGTFITDRTQADIDATLTLFNKIKTSGWDSLSVTEQATYLSIDQDYEDRGRFSKASAERISSYMQEITAQMLSSEEQPATLPAVVDGRTISAWGRRNFETDPDYPSGVTKTFTIANVNTATDEVTLTSHGFTVGQWYRLKYTTDDTTLGGLTNGNYYDVYIKDANTIAFRYGGIGTDITSKPASGTYTLEFITAPYMPISRDDFQYWVDILTVAYTDNPIGWNPNTSPYLTYETLNALEYASEAILARTLTTITEYTGRYITGDDILAFDEYL